MALKKTYTNEMGQEQNGFFSSFFIDEGNFHNLDYYSKSTGKKQSELINELLNEFFEDVVKPTLQKRA